MYYVLGSCDDACNPGWQLVRLDGSRGDVYPAEGCSSEAAWQEILGCAYETAEYFETPLALAKAYQKLRGGVKCRGN